MHFDLLSRKCLFLQRLILSTAVHIEEIQSQSIGYDRHTGKAHRSSADHRIHLESVQTCSQRDADQVVEECPEQILMNVSDCLSG